MALTTDQMKSWVEDLIGKNRILEEQVKSLNSQQRISVEAEGPGHGHEKEQDENLHAKFCALEKEVKEVKSGQSDVLTKIGALEQENQTLKLEILELIGKLEILEQKMSNGIGGHGQEDNPPPRKQRKIDSNSSTAEVSSDHEIITVNVNPLEVEEIVRIIMGHVKPMDLLNCRQVSKLWKKASEKDFQEKLIFHINTKDYVFRDVKLFMTHSARSFPTFRNLRVDLDDRPSLDRVKGMTQLFATHGKSLRTLQLNFTGKKYSDKWNVDDFRDIFMSSLDEIRELKINMLCYLIHEDQMFFPHHVKKILPNLTTLNIGLNCNPCDYNHHGNTQVFADFLRLIPNLKTLYWRSWDYEKEEQDGSKNFIESLLLIKPIKLENLFIYSGIADGLACSIANSNLNLKQLYLVEFRGFGLHFYSTPTGDQKKCEVSPKNSTYSRGQDGLDLKAHLEITLAKTMNLSCTKLLQVFASTLNRKLTQG